MKKKNIVSLILIMLGVLLAAYLIYGPCPFQDYASCGMRGLFIIWISFPLIILGILIFIIGSIVQKVKSKNPENK